MNWEEYTPTQYVKATLNGNGTNTITYEHGLSATPTFVQAQGLNAVSERNEKGYELPR